MSGKASCWNHVVGLLALDALMVALMASSLTALHAAPLPDPPAKGAGGTFDLVGHAPLAHAIAVDANASITAAFDAEVDALSVNTATFTVNSEFAGRMTGTYTVSGAALEFQPSRPYLAGEQVRVVATAGIRSSEGDLSLRPRQWSFLAGPVRPACVGAVDVYGAFTDSGATLLDLSDGAAAWGDYDGDGDLDILLTGATDSQKVAKVYRNDGPLAGSGWAFLDIEAGLPGVALGSAAWGDYDSDGDLDILLTGVAEPGRLAEIYRNEGGAFTAIGAGLPGVDDSAAAWGDYDNDGDLDLLLTGQTDTDFIARLYRNDGPSPDPGWTFVDAGVSLPGLDQGSVAWGDYDRDGDVDFLLTGQTAFSGFVADVFRNDGPPAGSGWTFTATGAQLPGVDDSAAAWGDYDKDGDLDILLTGSTGFSGGRVARVYRNDGGSFKVIAAQFPGVTYGSAAWGDYDNDADLDILFTGWTLDYFETFLYRNDGGVFSLASSGLPNVAHSSVAWGDYDQDGDLDVLLSGAEYPANPVTGVYRRVDCLTLFLPAIAGG